MTEEKKFDVSHQLARALCIVSLAIALVIAIVWMSHRRSAAPNKQPQSAPRLTVVHQNHEFFGSAVAIWNGTEEHSNKFPLTTDRLSDENPEQRLTLQLPKKAAEWCFITLKLKNGEEYAYQLRNSTFETIASLFLDDNGKPALILDGRITHSDLQPKKLRFYTFNTLYAGARISIKNDAGKVMWVSIPSEPQEHDRFMQRQGWNAAVEVPPNFDLTKRYVMRIHFRNGTASRYPFYRIGTDSEPAYYLHVCSDLPWEKGSYGLQPRVYLNGGGKEVKPDTH